MKHLLNTGRVVFVASAALLCSLLVAVPQASATDSWPQEVRGSGDLSASPDGVVLSGECYTGWSGSTLPPSSTAFGADGDQLFQLAPVANAPVTYRFCGAETTVNTDGTFYGIKTTAITSSYRQHAIVAYKNGDLLWEHPIAEMCSNQETAPDQVTVGPDGDVYAVVEASCVGPFSSNKAFVLIGLAKATGAEKFSQSLGSAAGRYKTVNAATPILMPYVGGLITAVGNSYSRAFRFFSTSGMEDTGKRQDISASYAMDAWNAAGNGTVFVATQASSGSCNPGLITNAVMSYPVSGSPVTYSVAAECLHSTYISPTPDGGAVLVRDQAFGSQQLTHPVLKLWPSSSTFSSFVVPEMDVAQYGASAVAVDISGNVLLGRSLDRQSGDHDRIVELTLFGESGKVRAQYRSPHDNANSRQDQSSLYSDSGYGLALSKGIVYFAVVNNHGSQFTVEKAPFMEIDSKYPETLVMGVAPSAPAALKYVALGDSFSSGEGVPTGAGFIPPTETNGCRRSYKAYSMLLDKDPTLPFSMAAQDFRACSGATTTTVEEGMNGESGQLDSLGGDTDVVTISVGGNNAGFKGYLIACLDPSPTATGCDSTTTAYATIMDKITNDVPGELADLYEEMQNRLLGNANVKVLVVGYPFIFREHFPSGCLSISPAEQSAAEQATIALNDTIAMAVVSLGDSRFKFVDAASQGSPFTGHDLCASASLDSYFNGVNAPPNTEYTAHPNEKGQAAYASLVANYWHAIS